jgi:hypothetical protein
MRRIWTLVGGACAGGIAMFLFDPAEGLRRRGALRSGSRRLTRWGADRVARAARRTARETRGLWWRVAHAWNASPSDEVLAERVRSQVGHAVCHGGSVVVAVHDGRVTLSGRVFCGEVRRLLHRISRIPGVSEIVNDLEAYPKPCDQNAASA